MQRSPAAGIAARRGSATAGDAYTTSLTRTHTRTRGTPEHSYALPNVVALFGFLSFLYYSVLHDLRSEIPTMPAHATSCPPNVQECFLWSVATDSLAAP